MAPRDNEIAEKKIADSSKALLVLSIVIGLGLSGDVLYSAQANTWQKFFSFLSVTLLVSATALVTGCLLGFLFGIPKTLQDDGADPARRDDLDRGGFAYRVNTNLEHISDWLTKILVGVGLTQVTVLPEKLHGLSTATAAGLDGTDASRIFVSAAIVFFTISGFLFSYLWTRLFLPEAFRRADLNTLVIRLEEANKGVEEVNQKITDLMQEKLDAGALALAQQELIPDAPHGSQKELDEAIAAASGPARIQILSLAEKIRGENWNANKPRMESTLPIFRALIAADAKQEDHRNHAQVGHIYKDQQNPNLRAAEAEFTKAIEIRGAWQEKGWLFYEFNRAICRIQMDEDFRAGRPSSDATRLLIFDDLRAAASGEPRGHISSEPDIINWLSLNNLSENDLYHAPDDKPFV